MLDVGKKENTHIHRPKVALLYPKGQCEVLPAVKKAQTPDTLKADTNYNKSTNKKKYYLQGCRQVGYMNTSQNTRK